MADEHAHHGRLVVETPIDLIAFLSRLDDLVETWESEGDESLKLPSEWMAELSERFNDQ